MGACDDVIPLPWHKEVSTKMIGEGAGGVTFDLCTGLFVAIDGAMGPDGWPF